MYKHYKTTNHALGAKQRVFETKLDDLGSQADSRVAPRPAPPVASSDTPMIVIARHGKPALNRHIWINATQYLDWWAQYDAGGLAANQVVPNGLIQALQACKTVVSSSLRRALERGHIGTVVIAGAYQHDRIGIDQGRRQSDRGRSVARAPDI